METSPISILVSRTRQTCILPTRDLKLPSQPWKLHPPCSYGVIFPGSGSTYYHLNEVTNLIDISISAPRLEALHRIPLLCENCYPDFDSGLAIQTFGNSLDVNLPSLRTADNMKIEGTIGRQVWSYLTFGTIPHIQIPVSSPLTLQIVFLTRGCSMCLATIV